MEKKSLFQHLVFISGITILVFLVWMPILNTGFLNDDFQILGFHNPITFWDCFKPFWNQDVSGVYWRPVVNVIHSICVWFFGLSPFPFRLINLIIYLTTCILLGYFANTLGLSKLASVATAVLFSVLPSHELEVGWIAGMGDSLMTMFLLISVICLFKAQRNNFVILYFISIFSFAAAAQCKEHAFTAVLLPLIFIIFSKKNWARTSIIASVTAVSIVILLISYRFFLIGGSPFESPNFSGFNIITVFKNFFIYIPVSFVSPYHLEFLYFNFFKSPFIILGIIPALLIIYFLVRCMRNMPDSQRKIFYFGLLWYIIMIIPALPLFMRWYAFSASIGLIISIGAVIEYMLTKTKLKKFAYILLLIPLIACPINYSQMKKWERASVKTTELLNSIHNIKNINSSLLTLWGVPDKIENVNTMKIGIQEAVQMTLTDDSLDVRSPLRLELFVGGKIKCTKIDDMKFVFLTENARLFPVFSPSKPLINNEEYYVVNKEYELKINTVLENGIVKSVANLEFFFSLYNNIDLYYNGKEFVKFPE